MLAAELSGDLERMPSGPGRLEVSKARRAELLEYIDQIRALLDETQRDLEQGGVSYDQLMLCAGRLGWALETAVGLQQGALALRQLEQADANRVAAAGSFVAAADAAAGGARLPAAGANGSSMDAAYGVIAVRLYECTARAVHLSWALERAEAEAEGERQLLRTSAGSVLSLPEAAIRLGASVLSFPGAVLSYPREGLEDAVAANVASVCEAVLYVSSLFGAVIPLHVDDRAESVGTPSR